MMKLPFELSTSVTLVNTERRNYTESSREASIKLELPWAMHVITQHELTCQAISATCDGNTATRLSHQRYLHIACTDVHCNIQLFDSGSVQLQDVEKLDMIGFPFRTAHSLTPRSGSFFRKLIFSQLAEIIMSVYPNQRFISVFKKRPSLISHLNLLYQYHSSIYVLVFQLISFLHACRSVFRMDIPFFPIRATLPLISSTLVLSS